MIGSSRIGFARRAAAYKRPDLLFADPERLTAIASRRGGLQIVYAGKAHPQGILSYSRGDGRVRRVKKEWGFL